MFLRKDLFSKEANTIIRMCAEEKIESAIAKGKEWTDTHS